MCGNFFFNLFFVIAFFFLSSPVFSLGQSGVELDLFGGGVGARALGMGGAFTAVVDNVDSPYWNPAGLSRLRASEITTMQTRLSTDADHYYVSYAAPWWGGAFGLSWVQVGLGRISRTSAEVDGNNEVQNLGTFDHYSNAYLLSYGRQLNDRLAFGLTFKYINSSMSDISGGESSGYSLSPGLLVEIPDPLLNGLEKILLGLKVDELISRQSWTSGFEEQFAPRVRLGLACQFRKLGTISFDLCQIVRSGYSSEGAVGYEWRGGGIALRGGYAKGGPAAGAGFSIGRAEVDYAYVHQPGLSRENVHRVSLTGGW